MSERRQRAVDVREMRSGDHLCWAFSDDDEFLASLATYIRKGLALRERVACYVEPRRLDAVGKMIDRTFEFAAARGRGALVTGSTEDAYLPDGDFDADKRIEAYAAMVDEALGEGYTGLRVIGEVNDLVHERAGEAWSAYEVRADMMIARLPLTGVCAFDLRSAACGRADMLQAIHPSWAGAWGPEPAFYLHAAADGGLDLGGEVDIQSSPAVSYLTTETARDLPQPVLDVGALRFVDVSGMRALIAGARAIDRAHGRVQIRGANPLFTRMWDLLLSEPMPNAELVPA